MARTRNSRKVRYAVVGLGHIAQVAVLPAFAHAKRNTELAALVSDDPVKLRKLGKRYGVKRTYSYAAFEACLTSGEIDAVYIALPNHLHRDYAIMAAQAGIHILCEKPLAVTERECEDMIEAADRHGVYLMTAYRLHFEKANLKAMDIVTSGRLGETTVFHSAFTTPVDRADNIRLNSEELGGGPFYDIGIYCINAARALFRAEPIEVAAMTLPGNDRRFEDVDPIAAGLLRFPKNRIASFVSSFGARDAGWYQVLGTNGDLRVDPAFEYAETLRHVLTLRGRKKETSFPKRDQFGPELVYFSDCILQGKPPEPSGREGLADVRIIRALLHAARSGKSVHLEAFERGGRPTVGQERRLPPIKKPKLVHASAPSRG